MNEPRQYTPLSSSTALFARTLYSGYRMSSTRKRNNTRLSVRVTTDEWAGWSACSISMEKPLSAIIRDAVAEYIADPPLEPEPREMLRRMAKPAARVGLLSALRETNHLNKVIVLRLSTEDLRQWKMLARAFKKPLSVMIRRAVNLYLAEEEYYVRKLVSGWRKEDDSESEGVDSV